MTGFNNQNQSAQGSNPMAGFQFPAPWETQPNALGSGMFSMPTDMIASPIASAPVGGGGNSFFQQKNADGSTSGGWGTAALGVGQGLMNAYLGMQQYGLAKDQLAQGKAVFEKNYAAQRATTNASMEDRQRARVASNPGAYQSVGEYMNKNGIK